jgi:hypothetical protein
MPDWSKPISHGLKVNIAGLETMINFAETGNQA